MLKYQICTNRPLLINRSQLEKDEIAKLGINTKKGLDGFHTLYQIKSLRNIALPDDTVIPKGTYGGYVEHHINLDTNDESWIDVDVAVYQYARVTQNTVITGQTYVRGLFMPAESMAIQVPQGDVLYCDHSQICSRQSGVIMQRDTPISREDFDAFMKFQNENYYAEQQNVLRAFDF